MEWAAFRLNLGPDTSFEVWLAQEYPSQWLGDTWTRAPSRHGAGDRTAQGELLYWVALTEKEIGILRAYTENYEELQKRGEEKTT